MKVLFLTNLPSPYRVKFFSELGKLCELTVIYERESASDRDAKWRVKSDNTFTEIFLRGKTIGTDNSFCPEVLKYLSSDYDVVVIGMYSTYTAMLAMLWMKLRHIPYCISTDGGFIKEESPAKELFKTKLLSSAKYWLGTGKIAREYLLHYGANNEQIFDYPFTSIDDKDILTEITGYEVKAQLRNKLSIKGNKVIISVGQFIHRKGFDILIDAFRKIHADGIELLIIGGTESRLIEEIGNEIPDGVTIRPFMSKEELFEYYKAADLFVLPTREDVWGLVVNEAMACGLPIITTEKCGSGVELVKEDRNGYIVPIEDVDGLAMSMKKILESNTLEEKGTESLRIIERYTFQTMAKTHFDIFFCNMRG